jgi:hypothetical protein
MRYLDPLSVPMSLSWMTAVDQVLGVYPGSGGWRVTWVRLDPMGDDQSAITIVVHDEPLACDLAGVDASDLVDGPPLDAIPQPVAIRSVLDAPANRQAMNVEDAAIRRAGCDVGPDRSRWINNGVAGWNYICLLRGHE